MRQRIWRSTTASRLSMITTAPPALIPRHPAVPDGPIQPAGLSTDGGAYGAGKLRLALAGKQGRDHPGIAAIDIFPEDDAAVIARNGGPVLDIDRHRLLEMARIRLALADALLQLLVGHYEQMLGQRLDLLYPHTAMAEGPLIRKKGMLGRRVMKIDVERVRHFELDAAQRVVRPRKLDDVAIFHFHMLRFKIAGILVQL